MDKKNKGDKQRITNNTGPNKQSAIQPWITNCISGFAVLTTIVLAAFAISTNNARDFGVLESTVAHHSARLEGIDTNLSELTSNVSTLQTDIAVLNERIDGLIGSLDDIRGEIRDLRGFAGLSDDHMRYI